MGLVECGVDWDVELAERVEGRPCAELAPTDVLACGQCSVAYRSCEQVNSCEMHV